jgi:hypothetical protein
MTGELRGPLLESLAILVDVRYHSRAVPELPEEQAGQQKVDSENGGDDNRE